MDATAPITTDDGRTFDKWNVSLAISQNLQPDGSQPISVALRCVPTRVFVSDGVQQTETLDSHAVGLCRGRAEEIGDEQEREAFVAIQEAVVTFLRAKGL